MPSGSKWTRDETLMAWALYMILPAKEIDDEGQDVQRLARALGRSANAVALKVWNIAAHDERRLAKGKVGMSHGSHLDAEIWDDFAREGDALLERAVRLLADALNRGSASESVEYAVVDLPIGATKETTVAARVNQRYFRNRLLENYDGRCCLTGLSLPSLLVASHIKPWSDSDPVTERLAPDNGLLLNSLHDRAFDQGLITLDNELRVVVSPVVPKDDKAAAEYLWNFEGQQIAEPLAFSPRQEFIEYHNDVIFQRGA